MTEKYRALAGRYADQVYSLACYLLADASEAEDIAQESFIKLWQRLDTLDEAWMGAWLMKVTRNACLDRLRARKSQVELDEGMFVMEAGGEPANVFERDRLQQQLMTAIHAMEEPWRSLLILRDIHEHSYDSVAEILELSSSQVKVYLHRARNKLASLLAQHATNN